MSYLGNLLLESSEGAYVSIREMQWNTMPWSILAERRRERLRMWDTLCLTITMIYSLLTFTNKFPTYIMILLLSPADQNITLSSVLCEECIPFKNVFDTFLKI